MTRTIDDKMNNNVYIINFQKECDHYDLFSISTIFDFDKPQLLAKFRLINISAISLFW